MSKWINFQEQWFNLDDFCHIWIEINKTNNKYYAMGEWRHNGEEVIITDVWDSKDELRMYLNRKLEYAKAQKDANFAKISAINEILLA